MADLTPEHFIPPGDVPKVEPTRDFFRELRASLKNAQAIECDLRMEAAFMRVEIDRLRKAWPEGREGMVVVFDSLTHEYLGCMGRASWDVLLAEGDGDTC